MLSIVNFTQAKNSFPFTLTDELDEEYCKDCDVEMYSSHYYDMLGDIQNDDLDNLAWETKSLEQADQIIAISELGLWNDKRIGYKQINHPQNLKQVIFETVGRNCELGKVILNENGDIAYSLAHHDGTNYVVIRERKKNVSEENWDKMLNAIYYQNTEEAEELIKKCTKRTGKYIKHFLKT